MQTHIPTLLQREWMQHKRGWVITALAPPLLFLAILPFGEIKGMPTESLELASIAMLFFSALAVYGICMLVALFQLPGLARRDVQDRSIEFWLSLPGRPSESVLSTLLAHAWLAPLAGAMVGLLFGMPIAVAVVTKQEGFSAAAGVNWGEVLLAAAPLVARGLAGTALLVLWLSPLILVMMAASAWLKRLGVPLVLVGGAVTVAVLHKAYDISWPWEALKGLEQRIAGTLIHDGRGLVEAVHTNATDLAAWALRDFGQALADLASLQFLGWAVVAAAGFTLVVMKRARGG
jgi:ABC-2 type transport system permease protein